MVLNTDNLRSRIATLAARVGVVTPLISTLQAQVNVYKPSMVRRTRPVYYWHVVSGYAQVCAVLCCAVLCCAVLCCAVLCCAVLCCAVLCCAVLCCAVLCCGAVHCWAAG
jgi:hypothetical protein